jgi:hypothetical protein
MMFVGFDKLSTVGCQKDFVVQGELIIIKRRTLDNSEECGLGPAIFTTDKSV